MNRRNFLTGIAGILAAGCAPRAVSSGMLMPVRDLWLPPLEIEPAMYSGLKSTWIDVMVREIYSTSPTVLMLRGVPIVFDS